MCSNKLACCFDYNALKVFYNLSKALNRYKASAKEYQELHSSIPH